MSNRPKLIEVPQVFQPAWKPSRYKGIYGGRGSGKSHDRATALVVNAASTERFRAVCLREVQKTLKESAKRLIEDKIDAMGLGGLFDIQRDQIITPGGGIILFQGMQDHSAESIKSLEGMRVAWVEEAQTLSDRSLEMLRPTIRAPGSELWFTWNPRNATDPVDRLLRSEKPPPDAILVKANWNDNPFFPAELEGERLFDLDTRRDRYAHIWEGEYEPVAIGAIWDRATINQHRRHDMPTMGRIVVAVDPAISNEAGSDEHGIVVVGLGDDGRGYVLADYSRKGTPTQWASTAVAAYDEFDADAVVIERNQGGDMCRFTLDAVRKGLRILEVHATRGKHVRAEPISALYTLGRVSHCGTFPELEDQMCRMTAAGYDGPGSPDRVDALVWGLTELFPKVNRSARKPGRGERFAPVEGGWMG